MDPASERYALSVAAAMAAVTGSQLAGAYLRDGDPDLVLHLAVCRAAGRLLGRGRPGKPVPERVPAAAAPPAAPPRPA